MIKIKLLLYPYYILGMASI